LAFQILTLVGAALITVECVLPALSTPKGEAIAASQCQACHGLQGKAVAPGIPNLAGQRQRYLEKTFDEFRDGSRVHGSLQSVVTKLSEDDARAVAQYYASLQPISPFKETAFNAYALGERLSESCASCHGSDGNSKRSGVPSLAGQQSKHIFNATQEYMTGVRHSAPMNPTLGTLDRLDIESLALFYASQKPISLDAPATGDAAKGRSLSIVCSGCHGARGISMDTNTPQPCWARSRLP
jgi:cytochrome c553